LVVWRWLRHNRSHIIVVVNMASPAIMPMSSRRVIAPPMDKQLNHVTEQADHEASAG
jgi:hypothetical protein